MVSQFTPLEIQQDSLGQESSLQVPEGMIQTHFLSRKLSLSQKNPFKKSSQNFQTKVIVREFQNYLPSHSSDYPVSPLTPYESPIGRNLSLQELTPLTSKKKEENKIQISSSPAKTIEYIEYYKKKFQYMKKLVPEIEDQFSFLAKINRNPQELEDKVALLKKLPNKKTVVLDLDEILIFAQNSHEDSEHFRVNKNRVIKTKKLGISFILRPLAKAFLAGLIKKYEIMIYTSETFQYAEDILNVIDPYSQFVSAILSKKQAINIKGCFIKDLRILGERNLKDIVLVDTSIVAGAYQPGNLYLIKPYAGNPEDDHLQILFEFLDKLWELPDIRLSLTKLFPIEKILEIIEFSGINVLCN